MRKKARSAHQALRALQKDVDTHREAFERVRESAHQVAAAAPQLFDTIEALDAENEALRTRLHEQARDFEQRSAHVHAAAESRVRTTQREIERLTDDNGRLSAAVQRLEEKLESTQQALDATQFSNKRLRERQKPEPAAAAPDLDYEGLRRAGEGLAAAEPHLTHLP